MSLLHGHVIREVVTHSGPDALRSTDAVLWQHLFALARPSCAADCEDLKTLRFVRNDASPVTRERQLHQFAEQFCQWAYYLGVDSECPSAICAPLRHDAC